MQESVSMAHGMVKDLLRGLQKPPLGPFTEWWTAGLGDH